MAETLAVDEFQLLGALRRFARVDPDTEDISLHLFQGRSLRTSPEGLAWLVARVQQGENPNLVLLEIFANCAQVS